MKISVNAVIIVVILLAGFGLIFFLGKPGVANKQTQNAISSPFLMDTTASDSAQLKVEDIKVGEGPEVKSSDTISIHYTGTLTDGTKFDSSRDSGQPFETQIGVGKVIKGWDIGVVGMKVGGMRKLTIPSALGYGERGAPPVIPPNATLIFDVELMGIK